MSLQTDATHDDSREYYEDFSLAVGLRDWLRPNLRHSQLRRLLDQVVTRRHLHVLDVGCGAGVMTSYLTRFGDVVGTDFSAPAIDAARRLVPEATFYAGTLDSVPADRPFDLITLFDVLEHILPADRPGLFLELRQRIADGGTLFMSTPHPAYTAVRRAQEDPTLQIIDEEVLLCEIATEAREAGFTLTRYEAYDVFNGSPEYQRVVFTAATPTHGAPRLRPAGLTNPGSKRWRATHALRLLRAGDRGSARWFLTGTSERVDS